MPGNPRPQHGPWVQDPVCKDAAFLGRAAFHGLSRALCPTLLAEMETLAVSGQEAGKKAKVAAIAAPASPNPKNPSKGDGKSGSKGEGSAKGDRTQTPKPKAPTTDAGCKFGKNCSLTRSRDLATKAGTSKAPGISNEAIQESLRLARVHLKAVSKMLDLRQDRGLIDGGATACLRQAQPCERQLPKVNVQLACGECSLHINAAGTLLSTEKVAPIVSVRALLRLSYRINCCEEECRIFHPQHGTIPVDASSGCPEISADMALSLIREYEEKIGTVKARQERINCLVADMKAASSSELAKLWKLGDAEADAAVLAYVRGLFPSVPLCMWEEVLCSLQTPHDEIPTWNRRIRCRLLRSKGIILHLFCGESRKAFEELATKHGLVHLAVDLSENLLGLGTFRFLLQLAAQGKIRAVIGGPPCRTLSLCRHFPFPESLGNAPRPLRIRGEPLFSSNDEWLSALTGQEVAQLRVDNTLFLRMMILYGVSVETSRLEDLPEPAFAAEQPEDPESWFDQAAQPQVVRPPEGFPSFWVTPEWKALKAKYHLEEIGFDQRPLGHARAKPTTLGTNLLPVPWLLNRGPGLDSRRSIHPSSNTLRMVTSHIVRTASIAPREVQGRGSTAEC